MAKITSSQAHLMSTLGIKGFTRDGYLKLVNEHWQTVGYANMLKLNGLNVITPYDMNSDIESENNGFKNPKLYIVSKLVQQKFKDFLEDLPTNVEIISMPSKSRFHEQKTYWNQKEENIRELINSGKTLSNLKIKQLFTKSDDLAFNISKFRAVNEHMYPKDYVLVVFDKSVDKLTFDSEHIKGTANLSLEDKSLILDTILDPLNNKPWHLTGLKHFDKPKFTFDYFKQNYTYFAFVNFKHVSGKLPNLWLSGIMNYNLESKSNISFLSLGNKNELSKSFATKLMHPFAQNLRDMSLHILLYSSSFHELMSEINELTRIFYSFDMKHITGKQNQKDNLKSIFRPISYQKSISSSYTKLIDIKTLSNCDPLTNTNLSDKDGSYFGFTNEANGPFIFNPYLKRHVELNLSKSVKDAFQRFGIHENQNCNVSLVSGLPGMGKSTLLKMLIQDSFLRGNYIRNFDNTGEYCNLTKHQKGKNVDMSNKHNSINIFEMFPTELDKDNYINEVSSYHDNLYRMATDAKILYNKFTSKDVKAIEDYLNGLFVFRGMMTLNPKFHLNEIKLFNLPSDQYPNIYEFIIYLSSDKAKELSRDHKIPLKKIIKGFKYIAKHYPTCCDHSTINKKVIRSHQVINFDFSQLRAKDKQLYLVSLVNTISLVNAQALKNYQHNHVLLTKYHKAKDDVPRYHINFDEADNFITPKYPHITHIVVNNLDSLNSLDCSVSINIVMLASFFNNLENEDVYMPSKYCDDIKVLMNLIEYFHIFNIDHIAQESLIKALKPYFQDVNIKLGLEQLCNLEPHQLLTIMKGNTAYLWQTEILDKELKNFN